MKTLFLILMVSNLAWAVSYKQTDNPKTTQRVDDGVFIPSDPENRDYIAFLAWQKEGGKILPADPPKPPVIDTVREQAILDAKDERLDAPIRLDALIKALDL